MKNPVLVIMAAGIGSRYGAGVKQLAKVGPSDELVIDYSIFDAKAAGFEKVIFVIRKDIEADFREVIGQRAEKYIQVEYAFQDADDLPEGFVRPEGRVKPWGTGHAVLACRDLIDGPFAVLNADDYYGKEAFKKIFDFLKQIPESETEYRCAMAGFVLENTLSAHGTVTRGVCQLDSEGKLIGVHETRGILRNPDGSIHGSYQGKDTELNADDLVSMNFWGFTSDFMDAIKTGFVDFLKGQREDELKSEYLLPVIVDGLLQKRRITVDVLPTNDRWFGITYQEDRAAVSKQLEEYVRRGEYPTPLF